MKVMMTHLTLKMPSNPKTSPNCISLEEGSRNGEGVAPNGGSNGPRGAPAMATAKKGGGGSPRRLASVAE